MRMHFIGPAAVDLPPPFGFRIEPDGVVEIPDNLVHHLRTDSYVIGVGPGLRMPLAAFWEPADAVGGANQGGELLPYPVQEGGALLPALKEHVEGEPEGRVGSMADDKPGPEPKHPLSERARKTS